MELPCSPEKKDYSVVDARYARDFTIGAKIADRSESEIHLADELWGPVFEKGCETIFVISQSPNTAPSGWPFSQKLP
jgi:hypothetical protein